MIYSVKVYLHTASLLNGKGGTVLQNNDWYIINEVHRTQNITRAANNLYMSQPTLTKRLHYLEDERADVVFVRGLYNCELERRFIAYIHQFYGTPEYRI